MKNKICALMTALVFALSMPLGVQAYEVPQDNSNIEYMYVFGPEGSPTRGAKKPQKEIYWCPMDTDIVSDKPGECPKCGMKLENK